MCIYGMRQERPGNESDVEAGGGNVKLCARSTLAGNSHPAHYKHMSAQDARAAESAHSSTRRRRQPAQKACETSGIRDAISVNSHAAQAGVVLTRIRTRNISIK